MANKIKRLSPESRALRKDAPIATKSAMSKNDRSVLDSEMNVRIIFSYKKAFNF